MNRLSLTTVLLMLAGLWSASAIAIDGLYFIGRAGPASSLSADGRQVDQAPVVYLRWDTTETALPDDISAFEIYRDGQLITPQPLPARGVMEADQIESLYNGRAQQRRLLETLSALKRQELGGLEPQQAPPALQPLPAFALNNFGQAIRERLLQPNSPFAALASRSDFNIARARYRAFLDTPPPPARKMDGARVHEYELVAVSETDQRSRIGLIQINLDEAVSVLPVSRFQQIEQLRCDTPDQGKDDYTVGLFWAAPGTVGGAEFGTPAPTAADIVASQLFVSGYDLYRTKDNVEPDKLPPPGIFGGVGGGFDRDLAAEAAALGHDTRGRIQFADLEQVNEVLISVAGANLVELNGTPQPLHLETQNELAKAGLRPGDARVYYLVPRDFAGQYGPTIATVVVVPDNSRPPPPWNVLVYNDPATSPSQTELIWDPIERERYLEAFGSGIRVCDDPRANDEPPSRYISVVDADEDCITGARRRIRLPADDFQVYRFDNFVAASKFKDSDGDGYSDAEERPSGQQCDAGSHPDKAINALVQPGLGATLGRRQLANGLGEMVVFTDPVPASRDEDGGGVKSGDIFWYRIASRAEDGRLSNLSAPVRVNFPDRQLPPQPDIGTFRYTQDCASCRFETLSPAGRWDLVDGIGSSDTVDVQCGSATFASRPLSSVSSEGGEFCGKLLANCPGTDPVSLVYQLQGDRGGRSCSATIPDDVQFCREGTVKLVPDQCALEPVEPGDVIEFGPLLVLGPTPPPNSCVTVRTEVGGESAPIRTFCGEPVELQLAVFPACVSATTRDENGNISPGLHLGCFSTQLGEEDSRPAPPQPVLLELADGVADIGWRLPVDPIVATLIELRREDDGAVQLATAARANEAADAAVERFELDLSSFNPPVATGQTFCLRLRGVPPGRGADGAQSAWSAPLCADADIDTPPDYLPWPPIAEAPWIGEAAFVPAGDLTAVTGPESALPAWAFTQFRYSGLIEKGRCELFKSPSGFAFPQCQPDMQTEMTAALQPFLNFAVFRQSRSPTGATGDFIQVTPRIDFAFWRVLSGDELQIAGANRQYADPWLRLYETGRANELGIAYLDTFPVILGHEYRYQIVHFSADNRIRAWRESGWIRVAEDGGAP